jgi:hypothetical protein
MNHEWTRINTNGSKNALPEMNHELPVLETKEKVNILFKEEVFQAFLIRVHSCPFVVNLVSFGFN